MSCLPRVASLILILFSLRALQSYYYRLLVFNEARHMIKYYK